MNTEKFNKAFDLFKDKFDGCFNTTLWRVCVDNITRGKLACFVSNYTKNGLQLGIAYANESGYIPCPAYFKSHDYDDACDVLEQLNEIIFELSDKESFRIQVSSMHKKEDEFNIH